MNPVLVTLYGEPRKTLGQSWIGALIQNAVTNVIGDVGGLVKGTESWQQAVLNFLVPDVGGIVGQYVYPVKKKTSPAPSTQQQTTSTTGNAVPLVITTLPLVGSIISNIVKGR